MSWKNVGCAAAAFQQISKFARSQPGSRTSSPCLERKSTPAMTRGQSLPAVKRQTLKVPRKSKSQGGDGHESSIVWAARCLLILIRCSYLSTLQPVLALWTMWNNCAQWKYLTSSNGIYHTFKQEYVEKQMMQKAKNRPVLHWRMHDTSFKVIIHPW